MNAIAKLKELERKHKAEKYKGFPVEYLGQQNYKPRTANGLTRCIIDYINYSGGFAERINNMGVYRDNRKQITDVVGRIRTIGSGQWTKGTGTKGTSDISAMYYGKSLKIEVKIAFDRQSEDQKEYQRKVESVGGLYYIAKDFDSFVEWFDNIH